MFIGVISRSRISFKGADKNALAEQKPALLNPQIPILQRLAIGNQRQLYISYSAMVQCYPWWALSIHCSVKSVLPPLSNFEYTLCSCRLFLAITCKHDAFHKSDRKFITYPNGTNDDPATATVTCTKNLVKIGRVPETCLWTDRRTHTNRHFYTTRLPYWRQSNNQFLPAQCCASTGTSNGPVSVCLSQVGDLSKWQDELRWFLARELPSTYPTVLKENLDTLYLQK